MRWLFVVRLAILLLPLTGAGAAWGADAPRSKPRAAITVWDTGRPAAKALAPTALAGKNDWTAIPVGQAADAVKGDAVVTNGRMVVVFRKQSSAVEVHAVKDGGAKERLRLRLMAVASAPVVRLDRVAIVENTRTGTCVEATYKTTEGAPVIGKFRIKRGDDSIQVEPGTGADTLRVECPGRFSVLPDFFGDDITVDATRMPLDAAELPGENFVLHLTADGDAMGLCVFESRQKDINVTLSGEGDRRVVTGSEIGFEDKKIWVALMEAPRIWHALDVEAGDTGKVIPLDWQMPFPAQWRVDFTRSNELNDSWEMLLQEQQDDKYIKASWLGGPGEEIDAQRNRWNTVLGNYSYPCWSDSERHGYLQPLKSEKLEFRGPAIIYPINRVTQTPLDAYTVVDVMRNTLGAGPCQHILDIEGQKQERKGLATCHVRDTITPIYEQHEQIAKLAEVEECIDGALDFVKHIRGRITRYVEFGTEMQQYLAQQQQEHPELTEPIAELDRLAKEIDERVADRVDKIKTPEHVEQMNRDFRKEVLEDDGPTALQECQSYARALVEIGGNQDHLVGECRWAVKSLRQRAGIMTARDPRLAPIALEIRTRTQAVLRNPADYEGARH